MIDKLLLGYLHYRDELTLYEMRGAMEKSVSMFYSTSYGGMFPAAKKLEQNGLITSRKTIENGRGKKYYRITPTGRKEFVAWITSPIEPDRIQDQGLLRIFFFSQVPGKKRRKIIGDYISTLKQQVMILTNIKTAALAKDIPKRDSEILRYQLAPLDFGLAYYDFAVKWYESFWEKIDYKEE